MWLATRGNIRTTAAAMRSDFPSALRVAFRTGGVCGLATAGLGLLGATLIILMFQNTSSAILIGFGFGGSLLALFSASGRHLHQAADVGADLVGKVEAGIPEDDPRNPATIADNVGDNVGDCAGMAADLFESFGVTLVASIILGVTAFKGIGLGSDVAARGFLVFPVAVMAIGLIASILGIFLVKAGPKDDDVSDRASTAASTSPRSSDRRRCDPGVRLHRRPEGSHRLQPGRSHVRGGDGRRGARVRRVLHHGVLHLHHDQACAGHCQGNPNGSGHDGPRRHLEWPRVVRLGTHRGGNGHRRRDPL